VSEQDADRSEFEPLQRIGGGSVRFEVEARLLQELGERLVTSAEVALLELIKNANDADAGECKVILDSYRGFASLRIEDDGIGMSPQDFLQRWMRIATNSKRDARTPRYGRAVTGQKGIGRFAIRYLGAAVRLTSVHADENGKKTVLEAVFDWRRLDKAALLSQAKVAYRISTAVDTRKTGTQLTVWRLKQDIVSAVDKNLLTRVLQIATPSSAFDAGPFAETFRLPGTQDPGYRVTFSGFDTLESESFDIVGIVLEHAWARLTVSVVKQTLTIRAHFYGEKKPRVLKVPFRNQLRHGLHADIAFTPKRKDSFAGAPVLRNRIWDWIKVNSGIGVIDNGFRIRPYGFNDDDWLYLNNDGAHNRRDWRSEVANKHFALSEVERARPKLNPALNLATGYQVLGAVFVSSRASDDASEQDLVPAMDREGFLKNAAYDQMVDAVRGALEFLAKEDKSRQLQAEEELAERMRLALRSDLAKTAAALQADPRLAPEERAALAQHYSQLASRVEAQDDYDRDARQRLEIAAGLGVVAGFMTHEAERLFLALDDVIDEIDARVKRIPELAKSLEKMRKAREQLDGYISYTRLFTDSLRMSQAEPFEALGQLEWIRDHFGGIPQSRGIDTEIDCAEDVTVPPVPVALYSAVVLNLYTNATKAILAREREDLPPQILISAWNDAKAHHVTVQDTGIGIPEDAKQRVWDPFFTTTSRVNSPLGSGMGLGLPLVRDLVSRVGGKAFIDEPSPGYVTNIHIQVPRRGHVQ
jgi:signal transduction histidine kinase